MRRPLHLLAIAAALTVTPALAQESPGALRLSSGSPGLQPRGAVRGEAVAPTSGTFAFSSASGQGFALTQSAGLAAGFRLPPEFAAQPSVVVPAAFGIGSPAGAYFDYRLNQWTVSSSLRQGLVSAPPGAARLDLGASYGFSVSSRHEIVLFGGVGVRAAGALPGLRADDLAIRSALRAYETGSGVRDMGLRLSWRYTLDRNLYFNTSIGYERLFGDAPEGAVGYDRNVGSFGAVFGYRFN